jgi:hypothetical protein
MRTVCAARQNIAAYVRIGSKPAISLMYAVCPVMLNNQTLIAQQLSQVK